MTIRKNIIFDEEISVAGLFGDLTIQEIKVNMDV